MLNEPEIETSVYPQVGVSTWWWKSNKNSWKLRDNISTCFSWSLASFILWLHILLLWGVNYFWDLTLWGVDISSHTHTFLFTQPSSIYSIMNTPITIDIYLCFCTTHYVVVPQCEIERQYDVMMKKWVYYSLLKWGKDSHLIEVTKPC